MKLKIGVVGCGRISGSHLEALYKLKDSIELVAVADIDENAAIAASKRHNCATFPTIDVMLRESAVEIVSICTPSGLHSTLGIKALAAGCHVITEKPMATRLRDGLKLVEAADRFNRLLFVVKQNRLNPTLIHLKKAIDQGRFGRISNIASNVFWTRPQSYYDQAKWRGTWELDGGSFMNQASHYIDLLTWLGGPLQSVASFNATLLRKIEADDCGVMMLKYRSGTLGTLNVSMLTYPKNYEGSITVIGEKGLVRIGGIALNKIETWQFEDSDPEDQKAISSSYGTDSVYGYGHMSFYLEVLKALQKEPHNAATGRDGLVSLSTIVAAYRSAKRGGLPIGFPLTM